MLYKQTAIVVMIAVMLVGASLLAGFPTLPALATHDLDAREVTTKQFSKEADEITTIGAIELTAKKAVLRQSGTITIEVIQNETKLASATMGTSGLTTTYTTHEVELDVEVEGSFEILVEYLGSGSVQGNSIEVLNGTQTAGGNPDDGGNGGDENPTQTAEEELEYIIATKTIPLDEEESLDIETVEFIAKKAVLRQSGTITVAIVQDDMVLDMDSMSTNGLSTTYSNLEASFDVEVTGEFKVVIMYEGSGSVQANAISVPGQTTTADDPDDPTPPDATVLLTVNAIDQNDQPISDLYVALLQGSTLVDEGFTEVTFTLTAGETYTAFMDDFFDENTQTSYEFVEWVDSDQDNSRTAELNDDEEYTARYTVTGNASPPADDPTPPADDPTPPPSGEPGSITAYAFRIPSEHWGPTFTSANAQMWFVLYNSTGWMVHSGFYDENGSTVSGLNEDEQYWIYATDCNECHGDPHDVVFRHWEDDSTLNPRAVTTGMSASAYYEYVPPS